MCVSSNVRNLFLTKKGYDTIANGATLAMPAFELFFGHYDAVTKELYLDSIWTSLWSSMTNVGSILGSAIAGPVSQKIGRRYTGMVFGAVTASHLQYFRILYYHGAGKSKELYY